MGKRLTSFCNKTTKAANGTSFQEVTAPSQEIVPNVIFMFHLQPETQRYNILICELDVLVDVVSYEQSQASCFQSLPTAGYGWLLNRCESYRMKVPKMFYSFNAEYLRLQ